MVESPRLCAHLASIGTGTAAFRVGEIINYYDGPVSAFVQCIACDSLALVEMLDWSPDHSLRIFALGGLEQRDAQALSEWLALQPVIAPPPPPGVNEIEWGEETRGRPYWDLCARVRACAGAPERVVALDIDRSEVLGVITAPVDVEFLLDEDWDARLLDEDDTRWFDRVGVEKRRRFRG